MRVIKFRAWRNKVNRFRFFDISTGFNVENADVFKSVEQFIGFQDINGNDIYEGDVLHQLDPVIWNPFAVEYSDQSASYIAGGVISKIAIKDQELVIVGNIHENPELIK